MLFCYILFGVGFGLHINQFMEINRAIQGTSPLLRSYIARVTSDDNRSTAYALQNGAMVMSVVVGPSTFIITDFNILLFLTIRSKRCSTLVAQLSFAGLPYPGAIIIPPNIKLNIFTGELFSYFFCCS